MEAHSQSPIRLLIVEDDEVTSTCLLDYFRTEPGYESTSVADVDTALRYLMQSPGYDVVLLDLSLPKRSGLDLLEEVQVSPADPSVIVLTGVDRLDDKLRAFDLGADDYVVKPCDIKELGARVEVVLRRRDNTSGSEQSTSYTFEDLEISFASNACFRNGRRVPLTALEFEILEYLVEHRGSVVPREELRGAVWSDRENICLRTIDRHVAKIREKIEANPELPGLLQTVYGKGYEFACVDYA